MPAVVKVLTDRKAKVALDLPCGQGWLRKMVSEGLILDGVDLFDAPMSGYRNFWAHDLNNGLPDKAALYDAIVSCEGIEHLGNPLRFLSQCMDHLVDGGVLIVTTPNVWNPGSRLKYFLLGFFPGFPSLAGKVKVGTHMHIIPWNFTQLWLFLKLSGFSQINLVNLDEKKPKHFFELLLGFPLKVYCLRKLKSSKTTEEADFWRQAGSEQSLYGRRLVVHAIRIDKSA